MKRQYADIFDLTFELVISKEELGDEVAKMAIGCGDAHTAVAPDGRLHSVDSS
jgi:hypothetical protein